MHIQVPPLLVLVAQLVRRLTDTLGALQVMGLLYIRQNSLNILGRQAFAPVMPRVSTYDMRIPSMFASCADSPAPSIFASSRFSCRRSRRSTCAGFDLLVPHAGALAEACEACGVLRTSHPGPGPSFWLGRQTRMPANCLLAPFFLLWAFLPHISTCVVRTLSTPS